MAFKILGQKQLDINTDLEELYSPVGAGAVISSLNLTDIYEKDSYVNIYIVKSGDSVLNQKTMLFNRLSVSALETKSLLAGITMEVGDKIFVEAVDSPSMLAELGDSYAGNVVIGYQENGLMVGYITKIKDVYWKLLSTDDLSEISSVKLDEKAANDTLSLDREGLYYSYVGETSGLIINSFAPISLDNLTQEFLVSQASADEAFQIRLTRNTTAIVFQDALNSSFITIIMAIAGSDGTVTFGTKQLVNGINIPVRDISGERIDDSTFVLTYPSANYYDIYGQMVQTSGTTFLVGTATRLHSAAGSASYLKRFGNVSKVNDGTLLFVYGCSNATGVATQGYGFTGVPATYFGLTIVPGTMYGFQQVAQAQYAQNHWVMGFDNTTEISGEGWAMVGWCQTDASLRASFHKCYTDGVTITEVSDIINVPYESAIATNINYPLLAKFGDWIGLCEYNDTVTKLMTINKDGVTNDPYTIKDGAPQYYSWCEHSDKSALLANRHTYHATPGTYLNYFITVDDNGSVISNLEMEQPAAAIPFNDDCYPSLRNNITFYEGENPMRVNRYGAIAVMNPGYLFTAKDVDANTDISTSSVVSLDEQFKTTFYSEGTTVYAKTLNTYDASYNTPEVIAAEGAKSVIAKFLTSTKVLLVYQTTGNELKAGIGDWDGVSTYTFGTFVTIKAVVGGFDFDEFEADKFLVAYTFENSSYMRRLTFSGNTITLGSEFAFVTNIDDECAISCLTENTFDVSLHRNSTILTYRLFYDETPDTFTRLTIPYALTGNGEHTKSVSDGDKTAYVVNNSKAEAKVTADSSYDVKGIAINAFGDEV